MVEGALEIIEQVYFQLNPPRIKTVDYCANPHPKYITEEHCPPKSAPEIPRREW